MSGQLPGRLDEDSDGVGRGNVVGDDEQQSQQLTESENGWKPRSMGAPVLVSFAVTSLLLAACVGGLALRSSTYGGLALSASLHDIPGSAIMAYKYVPIVLGILYSLAWAWVDQDVKRMQPWFELSRPQGAKGNDSLFLSYPHDFVAFAPWKAAKKRSVPVNSLNILFRGSVLPSGS
ncbi:hypothetical protein CDD83_5357 [Cordyceps sp. RAO-2017]|nr:hypothetical protein CDD83_5357 [Cordyceps sp. RAO-2017]